MKYLTYFLTLFVFLNLFVNTVSSQVIDSDYVRPVAEVQGEVLGIEDELAVETTQQAPTGFSGDIVVDVLVVLGGLTLIALFGYLVYSKKEDGVEKKVEEDKESN